MIREDTKKNKVRSSWSGCTEEEAIRVQPMRMSMPPRLPRSEGG